MQERMCELEREINEFKGKYEESQKDIEYVCDRCGREYSSPNGLHNHRENGKRKCSGKRINSRMAREARARRVAQSPVSGEQ